jgi:hypothetical protein
MLDDLADDEAEGIAAGVGIVVLPPRRVVPLGYWLAHRGEFLGKYLRHRHRSQSHVDRGGGGG